MKIVIIGAGSIGMLTAYYLTKNNLNPVLLTNRQEQSEKIIANGLHIDRQDSMKEKVLIDCQPLSSITSIGEIDVAIIAVKSHQLKNVLETIQGAKINAILFLQNGMGHTNLFSSIHIKEIGAAVVEHGALRMNDHSVKHTGIGRVRWSYIERGDMRLQRLFEEWDEPFFHLVYEQNWHEMLQSKLVINACINPLTALLGVRNGELIENAHYNNMMRLIFNEINDILHIRNIEETWKQVLKVCQDTAQNRSSMLVDVEQHRKTEIDSILLYLIDIANEKKVEVPVISFLYECIKGKTEIE